MLAAPLSGAILRALQDGPKQQVDLRREAGHPAQTTLRAQLRKLCDVGAIAKRRRNRFPGVLEYELSEAGHGLSPVRAILERWLRDSPDGSLELGGSAARAAVKALTDGWSTAMLRVLAAKPLTLTKIDSVIPSLNYPSLERRLSAMRLAGLVEAREGGGRGTPYSVTGWAQSGIGPILAAARWERRHTPTDTSPLAKLDIETAFLLAAGLLAPPPDASGSARLAVELRNDKGPLLAGVLLTVGEGRIATCTTRLAGNPEAWISGPAPAWLAALIERDLDGLQLGGDGTLCRTLLDNLHGALFALSVT